MNIESIASIPKEKYEVVFSTTSAAWNESKVVRINLIDGEFYVISIFDENLPKELHYKAEKTVLELTNDTKILTLKGQPEPSSIITGNGDSVEVIKKCYESVLFAAGFTAGKIESLKKELPSDKLLIVFEN